MSTTVDHVAPGRLGEATHELAAEHGARLADLFATPRGDGSLALRAVYALDQEHRYRVLEASITGATFPALSDLDPAAFVEECEIYERYGVRPANGKRLNRVLMPPHRAQDAARLGPNGRVWSGDELEPHVVEGEAFEFPFGPVRAAGWESLYMGLVTTGEEVLDLYLFYWHKHRGVEQRLAGQEPDRAAFFAERADGLSAVGDTLAFCRAVEAATETQVEEGPARTRSIALELERIYNHAAAIAALCQTTGLSVGQADSEIVLERLLRCNAAAFGHRYLFGVVCPGGVRRAADADAIRSQLPAALDELRRVTSGLLATNSHVDRLEATGMVTGEQAQRLGLVGPVARASGLEIDTRRDHPAAAGDELIGAIPTQQTGDVLARMLVMVEEINQAQRLVNEQLELAGAGATQLDPGPGEGFGWAESPRGEALAWVSVDDHGFIDQARLRPASVRNWRAFDDAARAQNVFTDIPIIEASFWLTVAGAAR